MNRPSLMFFERGDVTPKELAELRAELAAAKQQRDTLYSALQYIVGITKRRKDIQEYANHILDVIVCEETK